LWQLVVGDPEAVAQLIAETVAAMNISPGPNNEQDSDGNVQLKCQLQKCKWILQQKPRHAPLV